MDSSESSEFQRAERIAASGVDSCERSRFQRDQVIAASTVDSREAHRRPPLRAPLDPRDAGGEPPSNRREAPIEIIK